MSGIFHENQTRRDGFQAKNSPRLGSSGRLRWLPRASVQRRRSARGPSCSSRAVTGIGISLSRTCPNAERCPLSISRHRFRRSCAECLLRFLLQETKRDRCSPPPRENQPVPLRLDFRVKTATFRLVVFQVLSSCPRVLSSNPAPLRLEKTTQQHCRRGSFLPLLLLCSALWFLAPLAPAARWLQRNLCFHCKQKFLELTAWSQGWGQERGDSVKYEGLKSVLWSRLMIWAKTCTPPPFFFLFRRWKLVLLV